MSETRHKPAAHRDDDKRFFHPRVRPFRFGAQGRGDGKTHYTTWLVVRAAAGDVGDRPLPGGTVFWESPAIWVVSSLGIDMPVPGESNTVFARVLNLGLQDATGVVVRFWWANPALAINETTAHQINPNVLPAVTVPAQSSVVVQCPEAWIPVVENSGHECLFAEAYIPALDDLTAPFDPADDRHVGQKNEQLVLAPHGQQFLIRLQAANVTGIAQALTFEVAPLRLRTVPPLLVARKGLLARPIVPRTDALPLALRMQDGAGVFAGASAFFARRLLGAMLREVEGTAQDCFAPAQISHTADFAAWETRDVEITGRVPPDARPGDAFGFRVLQRAGRIVLGGYTHVLVADR